MLNSVGLVGRVARDADVRTSQDGNGVYGSFSLAVEHYNFNTKQNEADFFNIRVSGNVLNFIKKGTLVSVKGELRTGSYQDKDTGKNVQTVYVLADKKDGVSLLSKTSGNGNANNNAPANNNTGNQQTKAEAQAIMQDNDDIDW